MLSIGAIAVGGASYYTKLSRAGYYTASGEPPGRWWGKAAELLELGGEVSASQLSMLTAGYTPNGESLVRNAGSDKRRAGFDLTFSAPKSISVLWSQSASHIRNVIERAQSRAVEQALSYLQGEAGRTRRGCGGDQKLGASLAVAMFDHCTARAQMNQTPDPQLHTHALVLNVCFGEDGRWGALDATQLFRQKMTAGVLYRAELFACLQQELGLVPVKGERFCEIEGVPEAVIRAFSKRRAAIEAVLEGRGESSAVAAASAASATRKTKTEVNRTELLEEWKLQGNLLGFSPEQVPQRTLVRDEQALVRQAIPRALEAITETKAHFAKRDLVRAVAEEVEHQAVRIISIRCGVDRAMQDLVPLQEHRGEAQFTTRSMLHLERTLMYEAGALSFRRHAVTDEALAYGKLAARNELSQEQQDAVHHVTQGTSLALASGFAGTGKTTMIRAAANAWEHDGYKVVGAALAAQAARELERGAGIKSSSIHRTLYEIEKGNLVLDRQTVVVVDEASMVGTRLLQRLTSEVERTHAKLVLVGDERQLQAIEAGSPFANLLTRRDSARLTNVQRQREEWARRASLKFAEGRSREALEDYARHGLLHIGKNHNQVVSRLTADWKEDVRRVGLTETLVLTGTRTEMHEVNASIQQARFLAGELGEDGVKAASQQLFVGDRVRFRRNSEEVLNGELGMVVALSVEAQVLTVELDSGKQVDIDLQVYDAVELGYAGTTHSAQGQTVERCLVLCSSRMQSREMSYVQASRAREETRFYADKQTAGPDHDRLVRAMEQEQSHCMAHELLIEVA